MACMVRSIETFRKAISSLSKNTQATFESAYRSFPGIEELIASKPDEDQAYDALQEWINGLGKHPTTVRAYFGHIRRYLYHRGIKLDDLGIRQTLKFLSKVEEELYPLSREEIKSILEACNPKYRLMFLAQLSSGMRIGELADIRKRHLNTTKERIMVKIPASQTKTGRSRTTLFSQEVSDLLLPKLEKIDAQDLVFSRKTSTSNRRHSPIAYLRHLLKRIGLYQKYESNGRGTITPHSFRAFFITQASRHDQNVAKMFAGQRGYLLQYDRLRDDQKLEEYLKIEPDLLIWNHDGSGRENKQLEEPAASFDLLKSENSLLRERVKAIGDLEIQFEELRKKTKDIDEMKSQIKELRKKVYGTDKQKSQLDELASQITKLRKMLEGLDQQEIQLDELRKNAEDVRNLESQIRANVKTDNDAGVPKYKKWASRRMISDGDALLRENKRLKEQTNKLIKEIDDRKRKDKERGTNGQS